MRKPVLLMAVAAIAASLTAAPARAATFTVNSTADAIDDDPTDGVCEIAPGGPCTLRAAFNQGNGNDEADTIVLPAGEYVLTLPPTANEEHGGALFAVGSGRVDVVGAGPATTTVRQTATDRVFHMVAGILGDVGGPLSLSGITVRGGRVPETAFSRDGAGIRSIVGLLLDNVVVYDNQLLGADAVDVMGGGVSANGIPIEIRRSTIARNRSASDSGGLHLQAESILIEDSLITGNTAADGGGGGLSASVFDAVPLGDAGGGLIARTEISDNEAFGATADGEGDGGALLGGGSDGRPFVITRSLIAGNHAQSRAGALILGSSSQATIEHTTVSANTAGGSGPFFAGAIEKQFSPTNPLRLYFTTFTGNRNADGPWTLYGGGGTSLRVARSIVDGTCFGAFVNELHNVERTTSCGFADATSVQNADPLLAALADNGGPTRTHAIAPASPAVARVTGTACDTTDQRGATRASPCDSGAFELGPTAPPVTTLPPRVPDVDCDGIEDLDDPLPTDPSPAPGCMVEPAPTPTPTPTTPTPTATPTPVMTPPGGGLPAAPPRLYSGPLRRTRASDRFATYTFTYPRACLLAGQPFDVTLTVKRKKRKGNLFVKVRRVDFYVQSMRVKIDRKPIFRQRLRVPASQRPATTIALRARAFIKVKRGKSPTKSIRVTVRTCG